jgi:hypothetical protein
LFVETALADRRPRKVFLAKVILRLRGAARRDEFREFVSDSVARFLPEVFAVRKLARAG